MAGHASGANFRRAAFGRGRSAFAELMKAHGLRARGKRKFKATTNSAHDLPLSRTCSNASFPSIRQTGSGQATSLISGPRKAAVYLRRRHRCCSSRQIVGFAMSERMTRRLVIDALRMARFRRRPIRPTSSFGPRQPIRQRRFPEAASAFGMRGSMSRKGNCWDNAVTETLLGLT